MRFFPFLVAFGILISSCDPDNTVAPDPIIGSWQLETISWTGTGASNDGVNNLTYAYTGSGVDPLLAMNFGSDPQDYSFAGSYTSNDTITNATTTFPQTFTKTINQQGTWARGGASLSLNITQGTDPVSTEVITMTDSTLLIYQNVIENATDGPFTIEKDMQYEYFFKRIL
jgi:hypothetical protein